MSYARTVNKVLMTFKWKNSILFTIVISLILMLVNILFYVTLHSWAHEQQQSLLQREMDKFQLKLTDPAFYGTFLKPHLQSQIFPIKIEEWCEDLEEGQSLKVKEKMSRVIIEAEDKFPSLNNSNPNAKVKLLSIHQHINLPPFGDCVVTIYSLSDSGGDSIIEMNTLNLRE